MSEEQQGRNGSRRPREAPSQASLLARREEREVRQQQHLGRVTELMTEHKGLTEELSSGLEGVADHTHALDQLEQQRQETGLVALLSRTFSRRKAVLQRKSAAEGLLEQYGTVSKELARANAFCDELRLCALQLQEDVDGLHQESADQHEAERAAAWRILELEAELVALEEGEGPLGQAERARRIDQCTFELKTETINLELYRAHAELAKAELDPARALRDTVLRLHEEMTGYVVRATSSVNTAGRRIQALSLAADAPLVIAELHESLTELGEAMNATEDYVEHAHQLLTEVLPLLSAKVEASHAVRSHLLVDDLSTISRSRARELADQALREAAAAEIESLFKGE